MTDMVFQILGTSAGIAIALGGWLLIQRFVRSRTGCQGDKDPLDYMPNGCAGCKHSGECRKRKQEMHHHEAV